MTDKNTIEDLRRRLFEAIDGVRDGTLPLDRAKIVGDLSQVIVNSARVEVDYRRLTDQGESPFLEPAERDQETPPEQLPNGIVGIRRHLLKG